jgi:ankyrin repeat protein
MPDAVRLIAVAWVLLTCTPVAMAQTPPNATELAGYTGVFRAAAQDDAAEIAALVAAGADLDRRDARGRTVVHVAAFAGARSALLALAKAGADMNALDGEAYDAVTIAAVADDPETLSVALAAGNRADLVTSRWDGTALIAAAHLGHDEVVRRLIAARAPLNHVNNLGWTAVIEAVVLGDGGPRHQATVRALVAAGADLGLADREGQTPLMLAEARGYGAIATILRGE